MAATSGGYTFSQRPKPVHARHKYRPQQDLNATNLMSDRRVVRGNTYQASSLMKTKDLRNHPPEPRQTKSLGRTAREQRDRLRSRQRREETKQQQEPQLPSHEYLEELEDPKLSDMNTQTLEQEGGWSSQNQEPIPFIPKQAGHDRSTHMGENDLFDFEVSVEPVLAVLVGKSMDQAMTEVLQEEQIKQLKKHRKKFAQEIAVTYAQAQRLESELDRYKDEVQKREEQQKRVGQKLLEAQQEEVARSQAKNFYDGLQNAVVDRLAQTGHFYDPVSSQVQNSFMPWLIENTARELQLVGTAREAVDVLLQRGVELGLFEVSEKERLALEAIEVAETKARIEAEDRKVAEQLLERQRLQQEVEQRIVAEAAKAASLAEEAEGEGDVEDDEEDDEEN